MRSDKPETGEYARGGVRREVAIGDGVGRAVTSWIQLSVMVPLVVKKNFMPPEQPQLCAASYPCALNETSLWSITKPVALTAPIPICPLRLKQL